MHTPLVSIVIPTKNSAKFLEECLKSIQSQTYPSIEVLIIDSGSSDDTCAIAKIYKANVLTYVPSVPKGIFDAPYKRNYGVSKAKGTYVYILDADMRLPVSVIFEAVYLCEYRYDGLILCEDSYGKGIWAAAKNLERRCYWGDDTVEAPRFFKKKVWDSVGGIDTSVGGGGDDWDLFQKVKSAGYVIGRTRTIIYNDEGSLKLMDVLQKRFRYGRETVKYVKKRPKAGFISYFPIRPCYLSHWWMFASRVRDAVLFACMRTAEYTAGLLGILYYATTKNKNSSILA